MALYPWRFQAEVAKGETDPMVTVFVGAERVVINDAGEPTNDTFIQQDTSDPIMVPLSQLASVFGSKELTRMRAQQKAKRTLPPAPGVEKF